MFEMQKVSRNAVILLSLIFSKKVAVNHWVDGSNPSRGAIQNRSK